MTKRLRYVLAGHGPHFAAALLASVALNGLFTAADPLITRQLFDEGLVRRDFRAFAFFAALVVLFGVAMRVAFWALELLAQKLRNRLTESLSLRMLRTYYQLDFSATRQAESGYFLSRVYDEPAKVAQGAVATWIGTVVQAVTLLCAGTVALYLSWRITLLLLLIVPLLFHLAHRFGPKIKQVSKVENEEEARLRENLASALNAYTTVNLFSLFEVVRVRTWQSLGRFLDILYSRVKTAKSYQTLSQICLSLAEAAVLIAAGYEVLQGNLTIGGLFGFMNAFWKLINVANGAIAQLPEIAKLSGSIDRLIELENSARTQERADFDEIALAGVTAGYGDKEILRGLDLRLEPGERLLLVGPNGSGKSTLAYLITRFLDPVSGKVSAPKLERVSALLTPFPFIPGTLRENVEYERLSAEKRQVFWSLAEEVGLRDHVDQETNRLSEGQKKRAQILMTLLKDADLYVFDEPFAHIDPESKERILERLFERTEGKALLIILHGDEQFHPLFDRVVSLSDGRIVSASSRAVLAMTVASHA